MESVTSYAPVKVLDGDTELDIDTQLDDVNFDAKAYVDQLLGHPVDTADIDKDTTEITDDEIVIVKEDQDEGIAIITLYY